MKKINKYFSKVYIKSAREIDKISKDDEFYKAGEEVISGVLKEAKKIKLETGKRIVKKLWEEKGEKCLGLLSVVDIDFGYDFSSDKNDYLYKMDIGIENMKSVLSPLIEVKFFGLPIFKIVVEYLESKSKSVPKEYIESLQVAS